MKLSSMQTIRRGEPLPGLDRALLEGTWERGKNGATVTVEFQWLSEHQQVRREVKRPNSSIAALQI